MALVLKIGAQQTTNPNLILLDDLTGTYDAATNPTGFGAPNPDRGNITAISLSVLKPNSTDPLVVDVLPFPYRFMRLNTTLLVTPTLFGGGVVGTGISNATNATPIEITTDTAHGLATDQFATIQNVLGNISANGYWQVTVTATDKFTLNGSAGLDAYQTSAEDGATSFNNGVDFEDGVWKFDIAATISAQSYTATTYYLHTALIDCCISKEVAKQADNNCKDYSKFSEYITQLQQAQNAFECELYEEAQDIIDRLTKQCNCDCNCFN